MDFQEAQARFIGLQQSYRSGAIDQSTFLQEVSRLMVQDSQGSLWTLDPETGGWLHYDGRNWIESPAAVFGGTTERIEVIRRRRGCNSWTILLAGGIVGFAVLILTGLLAYRLWSISTPHVLTIFPPATSALSTAGQATPAPQDKAPYLAILQGTCETQAGNQAPWQPASNGETLHVGDAVRTSRGGRVQIIFSEEIVAELGENTQIILEQARLKAGDPPLIGLSLMFGDSWHKLDTGGTVVQYKVQTPAALISLNGTLVHIVAGLGQVTLVEVNEGTATVTAAGQSRQVMAGQKVEIRAGEPPIPVGEATVTPAPTVMAPPMATNTISCQYNAAFIGDITLPPGTALPPNQRVDKIWRMRNTGTCAWLGYTWAFVSGDLMGAPAAAPVPRTEPGGTVDVSVPLYAPGVPGPYSAVWQLRDAMGQYIGQAVSVQIAVWTTPTPTPPPTPTSTATPRPEPTLPPSVSFRAERDVLNLGECTRLQWDVEHVQAVYFNGAAAVGHDSRNVCPTGTALYTLCWRHSGQQHCQALTVLVNAPYNPPYY
jgi:hypothetical protein